MYCPRCGQEQATDSMRFCSRCGFAKQGALLMLIGAILVPIFGVMAGFAPGRLDNLFGFFAALSAVICFLGGPLRMLFAAIFEEGAPPTQFMSQMNYKI